MKGPVKGTFIKSGRYYLVQADGALRKWVALTKVQEGLPAFYRALADAHAKHLVSDSIPALIADWQKDVMPKHAPKTQKDEKRRMQIIAGSFDDFRACDMRSPDVADFLKHFESKPRTHNMMRADLRELMRYAEVRGYREPGTNPVLSVRTIGIQDRQRHLTDSELRRIKAGAMRGKDGELTRSGPMLCALIDMAYLTGQRVGDLLALDWDQVSDEGIAFRPSKTAKTTGAAVFVKTSVRLQEVIARLRKMGEERGAASPAVFVTQEGGRAQYDGIKTAWQRALERSGVKDAHIHDLRARALTDTNESHGMQEAKNKGAHSTEKQTAAYIRNRKATKTKATK